MKQTLNNENFIGYAPESGYFSSSYHIARTARFGAVLFFYHYENKIPSDLQVNQSNLVLQHLERSDFLQFLDKWVYQFWLEDFDQEYAEEEYRRASRNIASDNIGRYYRLDEFCLPCRNAFESSGFLVHAHLGCDWRLLCAEIVLFFRKEFVECLYIGNFSGVSESSSISVEEDPETRSNIADSIAREV